MQHSLVIGLEGTELTRKEREWLRAAPPLGVILFSRNIASVPQVCALLDDVRQCTGHPTWAAIDEEGGRVHRFNWPPFSDRLPAAVFGRRFRRDPLHACRLVREDAYRVGAALREMGFTHNCAPVLDVFSAEGDAIIGDRAYASEPEAVAELGCAAMEGYAAAGIEAVGKHFPGHGRADADSHLAVPHVHASHAQLLQEAMPFAHLIAHGLKHVMTAHVVYDQVDPSIATCSPFWIQQVLRRQMGFDGRVWSDDLCMRGVGEDPLQALQMAAAAGCDVLLVCQPAGVHAVYRELLG